MYGGITGQHLWEHYGNDCSITSLCPLSLWMHHFSTKIPVFNQKKGIESHCNARKMCRRRPPKPCTSSCQALPRSPFWGSLWENTGYDRAQGVPMGNTYWLVTEDNAHPLLPCTRSHTPSPSGATQPHAGRVKGGAEGWSFSFCPWQLWNTKHTTASGQAAWLGLSLPCQGNWLTDLIRHTEDGLGHPEAPSPAACCLQH